MSSRPLLVGTYARRVGASLERVWENVLDWEHLPWQHASTFGAIECIDSGDWGWRANLRPRVPSDGDPSLIELRVDRDRQCYSVTTLDGPGLDNEIWTRLVPVDAQRTDIEVDFHVAGVGPDQAAPVFSAFKTVYTRLWDEDEEMMQRRERLLTRSDERAHLTGDPALPVDLGSIEAVRGALPMIVKWEKRPFRVVEDGGEWLAHSIDCPHQLGPLDQVAVEAGTVRCPWHGYAFDLRSRQCLDKPNLRLAKPPRVVVDRDHDRVRLEA